MATHTAEIPVRTEQRSPAEHDHHTHYAPVSGPLATVTAAIPVVPTHGQPSMTRSQVALAILALSIGGFAIGVTEFAIMGLQLEAIADLGVTEAQGGTLVAMYAFGVVVGAPILSLLGAKRERRSYGLFLLALFIAAHIFSFFAPTYETMLIGRFLSGMPHGAYFACAALMAAHMAGPGKRARAIAVVLSGIAIANVAGVPVVTWVGQEFGWRWMYMIAAALALVTWFAVATFAPRMEAPEGASVRSEIRGALTWRLWVGVILAVFGFCGMFAVYSYISHITVRLAGIDAQYLPYVVAIFGLGMVIGNFIGGYFTDKSVLGTVLGAALAVAVLMLAFSAFAHIWWLMPILLFLSGLAASSLGPAMQTHLIDMAPNAPQLAASFQHAAFNGSNAIGALLGGWVIAAGWGLRAPSMVGAAAAVLGVLITLYAMYLNRRHGEPATS